MIKLKRDYVVVENLTNNSKCKFSYEGFTAKYSYRKCSYSKFKKVSKLWMNKKGDKDTGIFNGIDMKVRNGKVVKINLNWTPYDGGY